MKVLRRKLHLLVAALLLVVLATPCYAMSMPVTKPVDSMESFLAEYGRVSNSADVREYFAQEPLLCTGDVELTGGVGRVDLTALGGIRVTNGALVQLDDPELMIMGPPPCITVEKGGTLRIRHWHPMMTSDVMPTAGMIRVEVGGILQVAEGLTLPDGMVVVEKTPPNTLPPPKPEPEPKQVPIEALHEPIPQVESPTGQSSVVAVLPNTALVRLSNETGDLAALAVQWDLSGVHFNTPGVYTVYGDFIPEGLSAQGISNPRGLRPMVSLTILASTPVWDLAWAVTEPVAAGSAILRLTFSPLPEEVEHLYLQRSTDGVRWSRCAALKRPQDTDLLSDVTTRNGMSFVTSRQLMENAHFYLRLEVVGSLREGTSNILYIHALQSGDDGSSEGNRGGIQGTFDREGQKDAVQLPATDTSPPKGAQSEQELCYQTEAEAEAAPAEQESSLGGNTHSDAESENDGLSLKLEQTVFSENRTAKEDVPEAQPRTDNDVQLIQVAEKSDYLAVSAMAQPLATGSEQTVPQGDGDTSGLVAAATVAVCLFSAAELYILHKRSIKRKP